MSFKKLLQTAENEIGYLEKKSNAQLDHKTANAGSGNWTKYGRDLVKEIGAPYANGAAWCDMFVDWCFLKTFGKEKAKALLGGWSAYTPTSAQYYKNMKQWHTSGPQPGDQIFFQNATRIHHTGIVYQVDSAKVYTIEGNTSGYREVIENGGAVCRKSYLLSDGRIAGYGRPVYDTIAKNPAGAPSPVPHPAPAGTELRGIDVSAYNVITDYVRVKSAGVQFAILKIIRKDLQLDSLFTTHLNGFKSCGIPIAGVYNYSYATTAAKAQSDANTVAGFLKQYGLHTTVYLDVEDTCQKNLGHTLIDIINAYQEVIEQNGFPFGLYTGMSFYNTHIKPYKADLKCNTEWIARYPLRADLKITDPVPTSKKPDIGTSIEGWQYSSSGIIDGVKGKVDLDILYRSAAPKTVNRSSTSQCR